MRVLRRSAHRASSAPHARPDILATASRDGNVLLFDTRTRAIDNAWTPVCRITGAHVVSSMLKKRKRVSAVPAVVGWREEGDAQRVCCVLRSTV